MSEVELANKDAMLKLLEQYKTMTPEQQKTTAPVLVACMGVAGVNWVVKEHPAYATALIIALVAALGWSINNR
jgi:hypothetical protein